MESLAGTAVHVTPDRRLADEWATVLAASGTPYRLRARLDGWALIVAARDADAARAIIDAYDLENRADSTRARDAAATPVRGAAAVGVAVAFLMIAFFAATGPRASRSAWFERGSGNAERILAGEWWRTVTALTLHADASHVAGNAAASAVLVGATSYELGSGVGLGLILLAGAAGNALTAFARGAPYDSVGASTAAFGAIGILAATQIASRARRSAARKRWIVVVASLVLLALLGTSPDADFLAHLFGLIAGGAVGAAASLAQRWPLRPGAQWALAAGVLLIVVGAWLRAMF